MVSEAKKRVDTERGKRLRQARKSRAVTQKEMADRLGITTNAYQKYEYGKDISALRLVQICAFLDCSPSWLLGFDHDEPNVRTQPLGGYREELLLAAERLSDLGKSRLLGYADALAAFDGYAAPDEPGALE